MVSLGLRLGVDTSVWVPDPDAMSYVSRVQAAGATVDGAQLSALDTFYKSAKADSYYTSLKRLYLPIWEVAAANAICMISGTSGTFNGSVTHAAGYVQGNGSTGYFDIGATLDSLTTTTSSGFIVLNTLADAAGDRAMFGAFDGVSSTRVYDGIGAGIRYFDFTNATGGRQSSATNLRDTGVCSFHVTGTTQRSRTRKTSGITYSASETVGSLSAIPTVNLFFMAQNSNGPAALFTAGRFGVFSVADGMSDAVDASCTLALKTLWETCTGLTLP